MSRMPSQRALVGAASGALLLALAACGGPPGPIVPIVSLDVPPMSGAGRAATTLGSGSVFTPPPSDVVLVLNLGAARGSPTGVALPRILEALPQWQQSLSGAKLVDPEARVDWVLLFGPSLIHTDRSVVIVHHNTSDAVVERIVDRIADRTEGVRDFDVGVPGVKATRGQADNAARVYLRGQEHVLVVTSPRDAHDYALVVKQQGMNPRIPASEALSLSVKSPSRQIAMPGVPILAAVDEIHFSVAFESDGGARIDFDGDCADEGTAIAQAKALHALLEKGNSVAVRMATRGLLNDVKPEVKGKRFEIHIVASREQVESIMMFLTAALGVTAAESP